MRQRGKHRAVCDGVATLPTVHWDASITRVQANGGRHTFLPRIRWSIPRGALSGESMVITKLNRSLAKQDPEGTFENPFVIVDETMFTRGEKIATLDRWRQSILAELTAVGEVKRARLLGEIQEARNRLHR